jgi:hypothetical protein
MFLQESNTYSSIFWDKTPCSLSEALPSSCFMLVSCAPYFSTLKMEAKYSIQASVDF